MARSKAVARISWGNSGMSEVKAISEEELARAEEALILYGVGAIRSPMPVEAFLNLITSYRALSQKLKSIQDLVDKQAEDPGIWFDASHISEAYLQQELRRLHAVIEGNLNYEL
jgi:hypothetical protein